MKECAWHRARGTLSAASAQAGDWETHNFRIWNAQAPGFRTHWELSVRLLSYGGQCFLGDCGGFSREPILLLEIVPKAIAKECQLGWRCLVSVDWIFTWTCYQGCWTKGSTSHSEVSLWNDTGQGGRIPDTSSICHLAWLDDLMLFKESLLDTGFSQGNLVWFPHNTLMALMHTSSCLCILKYGIYFTL